MSILLNITGNGKGKTTSALGIVCRALGWNIPVAVIQFMKTPEFESGEMRFMRQCPDILFEQYGAGFSWQKNEQEHKAAAEAGWERAKKLLAERSGVIILDELNMAISLGWLNAGQVAEALKNRNPELSAVVTGRNAPSELIEISDTVSEINAVKHAFDAGKKAEKGIDL